MGDMEDWEGEEEAANGEPTPQTTADEADSHVTPRASGVPNNDDESDGDFAELRQQITNIDFNSSDAPNGNTNPSVLETPQRHLTPPTGSATATATQPVAINVLEANEWTGLSPLNPTTVDGLTPDRIHDGPMTPRNDAGPFVLDGSAGRASGARLRDTSNSDSDSIGALSTRSSNEAPSLPPVRFD